MQKCDILQCKNESTMLGEWKASIWNASTKVIGHFRSDLNTKGRSLLAAQSFDVFGMLI